MLIFDFVTIGNKLYGIRKKMGMTQAEVAEAAGLSERTYADIERGTVNMRIETLLRICTVLRITPDAVVTEEKDFSYNAELLFQQPNTCTPQEKETALRLLSVYMESLHQ